MSLAIERYLYVRLGMPVNERLCGLCSAGEVEDEKHFLIRYTLYHDIRYKIFLNAKNNIKNFNRLDFDNKY